MVKVPKLKLDSYQPLRDVIFETLRKAIVSGDIKPGERLMEVSLAEQMGVSRTPVREAIRRLEAEGLVTMVPRKGTHVSQLSIKDMMDVLEVRCALDKLATGLATEHIEPGQIKSLEGIHKQYVANVEKGNIEGAIRKDVEFHDMIYTISGNLRLISVATSLREHVYRFRVIYLTDTNIAENVLKEHEEILSAIRNADNTRAAELAEAHIRNQMESIIKMASEKAPEDLNSNG
ncbi:MAG TPA: GntR family transcriptional regulator [Ruminiclostridium sp.]|mgnify:CR=1 FL=1|jgi:DNA-binding GntR family transcriptional regulator|nr:GntR family transcriptional regulator [Ruminiclostridium sp.]